MELQIRSLAHRRFIGFELEKRGWQVIHIIERDKDRLPGVA
jgi:uncharacterized protein (DUF488 family)